MNAQNWIVDKTPDGWLIYDEENPDDGAAHIVVKGRGPEAEALAARTAALLNADAA